MKVGKEYKAAFNSACELINSNLLKDSPLFESKKIYVVGNKEKIVVGDRVYQYVEEESEEQGEMELSFKEDGATWFAAVREGGKENENAAWVDFLQALAAAYHKQYSLMEYRQRARTPREMEQDRKRCLDTLTRIVKLFFPHIGELTELGEFQSGEEDIYGMSLRLELNGGVGSCVPVLCKIYFRELNGVMIPLRKELAYEIDKSVGQIADEGNQTAAPVNFDSRVIDHTLNSLHSLVRGEVKDVGFIDCMCYSGEEDEVLVRKLREQGAHESAEFECKDIKVLGISHITWNTQTFDAFMDQRPVFRATVGLNQSIRLQCLNCRNADYLIDNDIIRYSVKNAKGVMEHKRAYLKHNEENFGLTAVQVQEICDSGLFAQHLMRIACPENCRNQGCSHIICGTMAVNLGNDREGKPIIKCADCDYPEILYTNAHGEKMYTPMLRYAKDKAELVRESEAAKCKCCGRYFTKENFTGKSSLCSFCSSVEKRMDPEGAKRKYKRYSRMLSLSLRRKYLRKEKLCYEDDEILLFLLAGTKYVFDKVAVSEYGFIEKPKKID